MKLTHFISGLILSAALVSAGDIPSSILRHSVNTSITNKDVVTLAKSGFDEDFLIRVILGARCSCDTSAEALADLANQGITQRIIEVLLDAAYRAGTVRLPVATVEPASITLAAAASDPVITPSAVPAPSRAAAINPVAVPGKVVSVPASGGRTVTEITSAKTSAVVTAVTGRVPLYESHSALWGIWRKKSSVQNGADPSSPQSIIWPTTLPGWYYPGNLQPSTGLGRIWHTAPYATFIPNVVPVYTNYLLAR